MPIKFLQPYFRVLPIAYQGHDISFSDWCSLLTLCLAPLIAHIVAGAPQPTYLCEHRPKWHDRICHYNPTSIIWRYAAITDRRIRATSWSRADVAATNAIFWTARGWDGSEDIAEESISYCILLPGHTRNTTLSIETIKTVIVTIQGIQAIVLLVQVFIVGSQSFPVWLGVDIIFFPLAFIGLQRLYCGLWLSDDFAYSIRPMDLDRDHLITRVMIGRPSLDSLLDYPASIIIKRFRGTSFWQSRLFRVIFLIPILGLWTIFVLYMLIGFVLTTTTFITVIFYLIFLTSTFVIFVYYFIRGHTTTTIIPCISTLWYKSYTGIVMALGGMLLIIGCIETRRTPCGKYTSGPGHDADLGACLMPTSDVIEVGPEKPYFGLAATNWEGRVNETISLEENENWVYNFTGTCLGDGKYAYAQRVKTEAVEKVRGD